MTPTPGTVYLVGAGPGDPGLLTRHGARLLRAADVVLHDRLVSPTMLRLVRPTAELIAVGKLPGQLRWTQEEINALLISSAKAGQVVVRLKGGDPFVFGRGNEERAACLQSGVPCLVVPGVTSAIAGPAAAGIPVTARGVARSFAVVTGHTGLAEIDTRADTVVVLMGRRLLGEIAERLMRAGHAPATPAVIVERATTSNQRSVRGTLDTIACRADEEGIEAPAVLVVGAVAARGIDTHPTPLTGARIVVTRPRRAARSLLEALRARGAEVILSPSFRVAYHSPDPTFLRSGPWNWIVFTSRHGVRGWWRLLDRHGLDARVTAGARVAVVGPSAARELRRVGIRADVIPARPRAAALIDELRPYLRVGTRVLFPCGPLAQRDTVTGLRKAGAVVRDVVVYDVTSRAPSPYLRRRMARGIDYLLLHSPSAARSVVEHGIPVAGVVIACLGSATAAEAVACGLSPDIVADDHSDRGLLLALESHRAGVVP